MAVEPEFGIGLMTANVQIQFETDVGFRITFNGRSVVLATMTIGKPGSTLSPRQILSLAQSLSAYESGIGQIARLPFRRAELTPSIVRVLSDDVAYKFTGEAGLAHWLRGSIKLNPPSTYLTIENPHARDMREGRGLIYLQGDVRFAILSSISGFNSLILCTSTDARKTEREIRTAKFGNRILKIKRATEFASLIAELSGAEDFTVRDVWYSDAKAVKAQSAFADQFSLEYGNGDLTDDKLRYIAERWIDEIIRVTAAASIFTEPVSFRIERERRFHFVFGHDVEDSLIVQDASLARYLEVIQ